MDENSSKDGELSSGFSSSDSSSQSEAIDRILHLSESLEQEINMFISEKNGIWRLLRKLSSIQSLFISLICSFLIVLSFSQDEILSPGIQNLFHEMSNRVSKVGFIVKYSPNPELMEEDSKSVKQSPSFFTSIFSCFKKYLNKYQVTPINNPNEDVENLDGVSNRDNNNDVMNVEDETIKISLLYPISLLKLSFKNQSVENKFISCQNSSDIQIRKYLMILIVILFLIDGLISNETVRIVSDVLFCVFIVIWLYFFNNSEFSKMNIQNYDDIGSCILGICSILSILPLLLAKCDSDSSFCESFDSPLSPIIRLSILPLLLIRSSWVLRVMTQSLYLIILMIGFEKQGILTFSSTCTLLLIGYLLPLILVGYYEYTKRVLFSRDLYHSMDLQVRVNSLKRSNKDVYLASSHDLYKVREVDEENLAEEDFSPPSNEVTTKHRGSLAMEYSLKTLQFNDVEIENLFNVNRWGRGYWGRGIGFFIAFITVLDFARLPSDVDSNILIFAIIRIFFTFLLTITSFMIKTGRLIQIWGDSTFVILFSFNLYRLIVLLTTDCGSNFQRFDCDTITGSADLKDLIIFLLFSIIFSAYTQWLLVLVGQTILLVLMFFVIPRYEESTSTSTYFFISFISLALMFGRYMLEYGIRGAFVTRYEEEYFKDSDAAKYREILKVIQGKVSRMNKGSKSPRPYGGSISAVLESSDSDIDGLDSSSTSKLNPNETSSHKLLSSIVKEVNSAQKMNERLMKPEKSITSSFYELPNSKTEEVEEVIEEKNSDSHSSSGYHMSDDDINLYSKLTKDVSYGLMSKDTSSSMSKDMESEKVESSTKDVSNQNTGYIFGFSLVELSFTPQSCESAFILSRWGSGKYRRRVNFCFSILILFLFIAILAKEGFNGIWNRRSFFAGGLPLCIIQFALYFWAPYTHKAKDKILWSNWFFFSFFLGTSIDLIELSLTGTDDYCPEGHATVCGYAKFDLPYPSHLVYAVIMPFIGLWAYWPLVVILTFIHWLLNITMLYALHSFDYMVLGTSIVIGLIMLGIRWLIEYEQRLSFFTGWNTLKGVEQKYSYGRLILDSVGIPITVSDMDGNIEFANDSFNLIFRYSSEDFKSEESPNVYDILEGFGVHNPTPDYGLESLGNGYAKNGEVIPILSSMKYLNFMGNMKMVHTIREMDFDEG